MNIERRRLLQRCTELVSAPFSHRQEEQGEILLDDSNAASVIGAFLNNELSRTSFLRIIARSILSGVSASVLSGCMQALQSSPANEPTPASISPAEQLAAQNEAEANAGTTIPAPTLSPSPPTPEPTPIIAPTEQPLYTYEEARAMLLIEIDPAAWDSFGDQLGHGTVLAFMDVTQRTGFRAKQAYQVFYIGNPNKPAGEQTSDGLAFSDGDTLVVNTAIPPPPGELEYALKIVEHEIAHRLCFDNYDNAEHDLRYYADLILTEGFAVWAARGILPDDVNLRTYIRDNYNEPLSLENTVLNQTNWRKCYSQWGSLVEYIIERYGRTTFDDLFCSLRVRMPDAIVTLPNGRSLISTHFPDVADYQGILGVDINQLSQDWLAWINEAP